MNVAKLRQFLLYSRLGRTDDNWNTLYEAGRLDIVYECIITSFFLSHGLRRNVNFNAILNGPPNPPLQLEIDGTKLYDVRTDVETWKQIIKKIFTRKSHPGIALNKNSFEAILKEKAQTSTVYVLEEKGKNIEDIQISENPLFILGDHVGLPKKAEKFVLRFGEKISLGRQPYLAASCITVINYLLDKKEKTS